MKIWVDDIRTPPSDEWLWCKNSEFTIRLLNAEKDYIEMFNAENDLEIMSLDHDLGGDDTSRPIVLWMCENDFWPVEVVVHSANPTGIDWLEGMIERYKP